MNIPGPVRSTLRELALDEQTFDLITAVNMKAIYHSALAVVPIMEKQGGGSILTTASTAGIRPRPGLTWYNASKGWAITATKSMAVELAPMRIRVNCLCPVAGETGMLAKEEWWYPIYMKEQCPGLPDWQALNACAARASVASTCSASRPLSSGRAIGGAVAQPAIASSSHGVVSPAKAMAVSAEALMTDRPRPASASRGPAPRR